MAGELEIDVALEDGEHVSATMGQPPGAPQRPPSDEELRTKLELCAGDQADALAALDWGSAAAYLRATMPA